MADEKVQVQVRHAQHSLSRRSSKSEVGKLDFLLGHQTCMT